MRSILFSLVALFGMNLWGQTNIQFQAHVPYTATEVSFSAYIADSTFNEGSHLNSNALWYVEGKVTPVNNSMINVLLENIPDSVFAGRFGKIYVYSYVNGTSLGKLPFHKLPYALHANHSELAGRSEVSDFAQDAKFAQHADTADFSKNGGHSVNADTSLFSWTAQRSRITNQVDTNGVATYSIQNASVTTKKIANGSVVAEKLADNSIENQHISDNAVTLDNLAGNSTAAVGSYVTKGVNGISWEINPHHKTLSVKVYTAAPTALPSDSRWVVSRVAVDYSIATVQTPSVGQLVTIHNGSTANGINVDATTWKIDTNLSSWIGPGQSRTLWYDGANWIVVQ